MLREAVASGGKTDRLESAFRLTFLVIAITSALGALIAFALPRHAGR
jgi:hypothetical protein